MKKKIEKICTTRQCESGLKTVAIPLKCLGISNTSLAYNIARFWDTLLIARIFSRLCEAWKSSTHIVRYPRVLSSKFWTRCTYNLRQIWRGHHNSLGHLLWTQNTRGDSHIKVTEMLVGKFKLNPQGRPMWVWLKVKLTPTGDFCVVSVSAFFVNFFMNSTKRYRNGQMSWLSMPNTLNETKICRLHPKARRRALHSL